MGETQMAWSFGFVVGMWVGLILVPTLKAIGDSIYRRRVSQLRDSLERRQMMIEEERRSYHEAGN